MLRLLSREETLTYPGRSYCFQYPLENQLQECCRQERGLQTSQTYHLHCHRGCSEPAVPSLPISIILLPWRANDDIVSLSGNIYRPPKSIVSHFSTDGLAERCPLPAIFASAIDFDISLSVGITNVITRGSTNYQSPCIDRESHRPSQIIISTHLGQLLDPITSNFLVAMGGSD